MFPHPPRVGGTIVAGPYRPAISSTATTGIAGELRIGATQSSVPMLLLNNKNLPIVAIETPSNGHSMTINGYSMSMNGDW